MAITENEIQKDWKKPFFTIWGVQAASLLGSQIVQFALIWWLTQTTGSATILAAASLVGLLPQVVLGPFVGALVDRWNRRIIMMVADGCVALATVGLIVLFALGVAQVWHIFVIIFIRSVAGGFHFPSMQASTSLMVPKEHLSRIQGLNQVLSGGMNIASAPLGALFLSILPMEGVLFIDVITAAIAITPLFFIHIPQPEPTAEQKAGSSTVWSDMVAGLKYVRSWTGLLIILVMAALINLLLNPAFSLLPVLVTKHFNGQAINLAAMESSMGIGVMVGGLILSVWGGFKKKVFTSMLGLFFMGATSICIGLLPGSAFTTAVVIMFIMGAANPITNGPLFAVIQAVVAPEMQGRVITLIMSASGIMSPLGLIMAGPIAERFGAQVWFVIGGIVTVLMAVSGVFIPALKAVEEEKKSIALGS